MATYTSETISFEAGDTTVTISDIGSSALTFYIINFGQIEYRHEVPNNDETNVTSIATQQGKVTIGVHDTLSDGTSLFEDLEAALTTTTSTLNVTVSVTGVGDVDLIIRYDGFKINEKTKIINIECTPAIRFDDETGASSGAQASINAIVTSETTRAYTVTDTNMNSFTAYVYRDLMEDYLNFAFSPSTLYFTSPPRVAANTATADIFQAEAGGTPYFTANHAQTWVLDDMAGAFTKVAGRMASLSGCFFGYAFNVGYHIYRLDTGSSGTTRTELDFDYVLDFTAERNLNTIWYLSNEMQTTTLYDGGLTAPESISSTTKRDNTDVSITLNAYGKQQYNITMKAPTLFYAYTSGTAATQSGSNTQENNLAQDILDAGIKAYTKALNAEAGKRVVIIVRGAMTVLPYQCFTLGSSFPSIYNKYRLDGANSIVYRPSVLKYDLTKDTTYIEAYKIGTV